MYPYMPAPVNATHRNFLRAFAHGSFYRMQKSLCVAITTTVARSVRDWALLTVQTVNCWHNDMQDTATTMFMKYKMAGIKSLNAVLGVLKYYAKTSPVAQMDGPYIFAVILAVFVSTMVLHHGFIAEPTFVLSKPSLVSLFGYSSLMCIDH